MDTNKSFFNIVLWAQRSSNSDPLKNIIYLTINVKDPQQESLVLDITDSKLDLKAKSTTSEEEYDLHIDFFKDIDASSIHQTITGSHIFIIAVKKDLDEEYWPRLTKDKIKYRNIRTDFDRWVDEDEQDEEEPANEFAGMEGMGGMPGMGGMGGMPGMPGMGGMPGMPGMGGMGDLDAFSKNNLDFSELAKQFGGMGDAGDGKSGPSQFGDFSGAKENDFSSSDDENDDGDDDDNDNEHEGHSHAHSHTHGDGDHHHEHGHSHSH